MPASSLSRIDVSAEELVETAHAEYREAHQSGDASAVEQAEANLRAAFAPRNRANEDAVAVTAGSRLERIANGWRVKTTDEYVIEVWKTLFNWRLVVMLPNQQATVEHGFCYFGLGLESLTRAVAAGLEWENPFTEKPNGYDKQAF